MLTCGGTYLLEISSAIAWTSKRSSVESEQIDSSTYFPSKPDMNLSIHPAPRKERHKTNFDYGEESTFTILFSFDDNSDELHLHSRDGFFLSKILVQYNHSQ